MSGKNFTAPVAETIIGIDTACERTRDQYWNTVRNFPLFIDFRLPVEWSIQDDRRETPVSPQQIVLSDVGRIASGNVVEALQLCLADADDDITGLEAIPMPWSTLRY